MDLLGTTPRPETALPEGISPSLENVEQEFAGIFAEVINGLAPQAPVLQMPIVENHADGEEVQSQALVLTPDITTDPEIAVGPKENVSPKFLSLENIETFQDNTDLDNSLGFKLAVNAPDSNMPLITIDGKEVSREIKIQGMPSSLPDSDWLTQLNLKEIHIVSEKALDAPIDLKHDSNEHLKFGQMSKIVPSDALINSKSPESKAESKQNAADGGREVIVSGKEMLANDSQPDFDNNLAQGQTRNQAKPETIPSEQFSGKIEKNEKLDVGLDGQQSTGQTKTEQNMSIESKMWTGIKADSHGDELKTNSSVRVIIPESAKQLSGHQKNSIMIKIEPEHLGPARLDLQMKNEVLTARLTVETTTAKSTLESSINTLKEQLAKADIKVEQIEINVRGETNYNQLFNRQPQWQKFNSAFQAKFNVDDLPESFVPVNQIYNFKENQYVGFAGVNVLA